MEFIQNTTKGSQLDTLNSTAVLSADSVLAAVAYPRVGPQSPFFASARNPRGHDGNMILRNFVLESMLSVITPEGSGQVPLACSKECSI